MNEKVVARMQASFDDCVANNLVNCMLYVLLVVFLAREVEWIYITATILLGALGVGLIVRQVLLFLGKVKPCRKSGATAGGLGWMVPGFFLLYALVAYLRAQPESALIWLILCALNALAVGAGFILSKRAERRS